MAQSWVVLLETSYEGDGDLSLEAVEALLARLADRFPSALYAPDRCAVQLLVGGSGPDDALASAIAAWREAALEVDLPAGDLVRAEVKTQAELATECEHADTTARPHAPADEQALALAYGATRKLLQATTAREAVSIVFALVRDLGGAVVAPVADDPRLLDLDLALGVCEPAMAAADPFSVERLCLEEVLPAVVEDARLAAAAFGAPPVSGDPAVSGGPAVPSGGAFVESDRP